MNDKKSVTDSARPSAITNRRRMMVFGAVAVAGLAALSLTFLGGGSSEDAVSLEQARAEHEAGRALLIDIREPQEHATGVVAGARLLPMRQLNQRMGEIPRDPDRPVLLICHTQNRSSATLRALRKQGYAHVRYVHGGMSEWNRREWPLVKPGSGSGG